MVDGGQLIVVKMFLQAADENMSSSDDDDDNNVTTTHLPASTEELPDMVWDYMRIYGKQKSLGIDFITT